MQGVEPTTSLIDSFRNEIRREGVLKGLLVLEWVMPLGKGHRAGIKPHIDQLGNPAHVSPAAALQCDRIDIGPVKIQRFGKGGSFAPELIHTADRALRLAAPANPYRKRRPPIPIS